MVLMKTRRSSTRTGAQAAIRVFLALLSLVSLLAFLAPVGASTIVVAAAAACDAGERPTVHDRQVEPLRVPMVRPSRDAHATAPGARDVSFSVPARLGLTSVAPGRPAASIDASIPTARARAERMVFLI
jgi:hypothetical protein